MKDVLNYVASVRHHMELDGFAVPKSGGASMRPLIWARDHCVVVVPLKGEPEIGDILMFRLSMEGKNIVHRLVAIEGVGDKRVYVARGDNCLGCERFGRDQIIGRVAEVHRMSGWRPWHAIHARKFTVSDPAYRRYVRLWTRLWPLRRFAYRVRGWLRKRM